MLADAVRLGEDIGSAPVLERYARWRRLDNVGVAAATDVFNRLFSNDNPLVRAARDAGMALVNRIGPARRFFMQRSRRRGGRPAAAAARRGALAIFGSGVLAGTGDSARLPKTSRA